MKREGCILLDRDAASFFAQMHSSLASGITSTTVLCAVKSAGPLRVKVPPENWFVPLGSNRSGGGGNKAVGASGVEGHMGDLASM